jgi:hypothetical protein
MIASATKNWHRADVGFLSRRQFGRQRSVARRSWLCSQHVA